jgi:hypothetical protein
MAEGIPNPTLDGTCAGQHCNVDFLIAEPGEVVSVWGNNQLRPVACPKANVSTAPGRRFGRPIYLVLLSLVSFAKTAEFMR